MLLLMLALGLLTLMFSHIVYGGSAVGLGLIAAILVVSLIVSTAIIFIPWFKSKLLHFTKTVWHLFTHRDITQFLADLDRGLTHGLVTLKDRPRELALLLAMMAGVWGFQAVALWFCLELSVMLLV